MEGLPLSIVDSFDGIASLADAASLVIVGVLEPIVGMSVISH
jgi:hypothetical protein